MDQIIETEQIELQLLLDAMRLKYGYDFSGYSHDVLKRRIALNASRHGIKSTADMIPKVLQDPGFFTSIVYDLSITVTEMFRDPDFYLDFRQKVIPVLKTYPFINIWHAGCATGQEVYSMAVILKEEGMYDRARIYATDINQGALDEAEKAIYPAEQIPLYTKNYQLAGGRESFADYYHAKYDAAKMDESLKENITFASHNLVTDGVFAEMHLIFCRNVFIYFDKVLQDRALKLFRDSLRHGGFLCLGSSETLQFSQVAEQFLEFVEKQKIYQKKTI
jgi:chemotaxis protein methyltransferase CheR